ncbi:aldo/keto reductase [Larkinella bovis]|uniref:Aldo/keto reductase n=1 Tax=Larkinella bovis TaxID=683041 RepID=A0ABW0IDC1_9BACT
MQYTPFHQYQVSKLALGTIQLGMNYGIANTGGAPSEMESFSLLDLARTAGINTFDSARTYGKAEQILGAYFNKLPACDDLIISKFKYDWSPRQSLEKAWELTEASIKASLTDLKRTQIGLVLYHKGAAEPMEEVFRIVPVLINRLKEKGYIQHGGISLYYSAEAHSLIDDPVFEAVQLPLNVFDQGIIQDGTLADLSTKGKLIFVRSVFLQGLFFRNPSELSGVLTQAIPFLTQLEGLARRYEFSVSELAFGFIRDLPEVHSLVIGAENQKQILSNLELLHGPTLPDSLKNELRELCKDVPKEVITPGLWNR